MGSEKDISAVRHEESNLHVQKHAVLMKQRHLSTKSDDVRKFRDTF